MGIFSRKFSYFQIFLFLVVFTLIGLIVYFSVNNTKTGNCVSEIKQVVLRGESLSGLLEPGAELKILIDYYKCHTVQRNDVVAYNYAGNEVPIIKIVKGVEGDKFELKKSGDCWNVLINNEVVKNSQELSHCFNEQGHKMLSLYERDYKGVIPQNTYLILGNLVSGTLDSTKFGLIDKGNILGRVIY